MSIGLIPRTDPAGAAAAAEAAAEAAANAALANKADLVAGEVPLTQLPAFSSVYIAAAKADLTSLTIQTNLGALAHVADATGAPLHEPGWFVLPAGSDHTVLGNWHEYDYDPSGVGAAAITTAGAYTDAQITALALGTASQKAVAYFQQALSDGGALTAWSANTPAVAGTIWSYNGVVYLRITTGTDSSFVRANWLVLGADPTVAGGGELAVATPATSPVTACTTSAWADIAGFVVGPVVPSSGRGIKVKPEFGITVSVAATGVVFQLYDNTAGAVAVGPNGSAAGAVGTTCAVASKGYPVAGCWLLNPAAGARSYKIQAKTVTNNCNVTVLCEDLGFEAALIVNAR